MYLHLGQDIVVLDSDIIGIFDLDNSSYSHITREFLKRATDNKQIINVSTELPKSFVICKKDNEIKVYISQLATSTLQKRAERELYV